MDMNSCRLQELVMGGEAWRAAIHGVAKGRTRLQDWTELWLTPFFQNKRKKIEEAWGTPCAPVGILPSVQHYLAPVLSPEQKSWPPMQVTPEPSDDLLAFRFLELHTKLSTEAESASFLLILQGETCFCKHLQPPGGLASCTPGNGDMADP